MDIWVLSWMPGQKTGFHDHDRSRVALVCAGRPLADGDYREHVQPHVRHILADVMQADVPVIHFGTDTGAAPCPSV